MSVTIKDIPFEIWKKEISWKEFLVIFDKYIKQTSIYEWLELDKEQKDFLDLSLKMNMIWLEDDVNYNLSDSEGIL